ncbi:MAG: amidohydrolase family protein [SAR202 cluster bacterium]|nr:amidohydrolase family protein [SAR202 cluster bacterium]
MSPAAFKVIKGARIIDSIQAKPLERGAILVEGSKIKWVGAEKDLEAPEGARVETFDYTGKTVLPGLVDVHTHTNLPGDGTAVEEGCAEPDEILMLRSAWNARKHLESGVTTARDNGAKNMTAMYLKQGIERGFIPGPRMVISGRPVTITGGHCWPMNGEADGVDGVREAVRRLIKEGVDWIKVMTTGGGTRSSYSSLPSYSVDELRVLTYEAHNFGKLVGAHCSATQGMVNSLDAGVNMIIHGTFHEPDGTYKFHPKVAERIAKQGVWVNPTLRVGNSTVTVLEAKQKAQGLTPPEVALLDSTKRRIHNRQDYCRRYIEMGVKLVSGSDSGWGNYPMGYFQWEVEDMAGLGLSNMDAVLSATRESAKSIGMDRLVGTLEAGKEADILVVDGNPLKEIKDLRKVAAVFKGGIKAK